MKGIRAKMFSGDGEDKKVIISIFLHSVES